MRLRKANAIISLIITVLLLDHGIYNSIWMLSRCTISRPVEISPWVLVGLMMLHAALSIVMAIIGHKGLKKVPMKTYPKLNFPTILQRATGIAMLVLLAVHIAGAANYFQPKYLHAVLHPLFFAVVLTHTSVSVSKALITLGIGSTKVLKSIDIILLIICGATLIASCIGFLLCLFMGVAK